MEYTFHRKFLRPRAVRSDQGFDVEFRGMLAVRYSEGERTVTFPAEPVKFQYGEFKGRAGWMVAVSRPFTWDDGIVMSQSERALVQERSRQALDFMGVAHVAT